MNSPGLVRSFINSISIVIIDEYFLEISHVMPGKPAATAGLRSGDRLITVNEVMVIFLPISDVMMALNMDQLMAYVEFERGVQKSLIFYQENFIPSGPHTGESFRQESWSRKTPKQRRPPVL